MSHRFFIAVLGLSLGLAYWGMRHNEAVYDDPVLIQGNPGIHSLRNLPRLFTPDYAQVSRYFKAYRPTAVAVHMLAYRLFGGSPNGHRIVNWLLHFLNAWLLFWICRRYFFPGAPVAFWAGLLFALHPAASECMLLAASLDAPLAFFFCQLAFWGYLRARESEGRLSLAWGLVSWISFVLGLFSKETAALFPLSLVAYEILHPNAPSRPWWRSPFLWSYGPPLVVYQQIRFRLFGEYVQAAPYIGGTLYTNFLTSLKAVLGYTRLLVWPHPLSISYRVHAARSWMEPAVLAGLGVVLALAAAAWIRRKDKTILFWMFALVWPMAAVMNWVPFFDEVSLVNDRHLYFSLSAFAVLSALALRRLAMRSVRPAAALGVAVLAAYSGLTVLRTRDWRDEVSVHRQAVRVDPRNYRAYNDLGWAYHRRGELSQAEESYLKAMALFPGIVTCVRLAAVYEDQNRIPEAIRLLDAALASADALSIRHYGIGQQMARLQFKLGTGFLKSGRLSQAAQAYEKAVRMDSTLDGAYHNLGLVYEAQRRLPEAAEAFRRALRLNPADELARLKLQRLERKP